MTEEFERGLDDPLEDLQRNQTPDISYSDFALIVPFSMKLKVLY